MGQMELRYNLATKVMRNGVEVIVATDRNARPVEPEYLRHLSSTVTRPITLAPHTLTNLMSMVLPTDEVVGGQNHLLSFLQPTFITRTYYTTYNYPTTIVDKDNGTLITNAETTIANIKTEQVPNLKSTENNIQAAAASTTESISLKASPTLQTEVFQTAYTYLNTFMDGDQPFVVSSTNTISNTVVGTMDTFGDLEPSEVFPTTNTYLKTIEFTKTLTDGVDFQIVSTKDVVTQVIVTDKPGKKAAAKIPITTDVTKTYFVTYTYFSTYIDGDETKVKSDVSVSSDVTIEKFYIKPKATETKNFEKIRKTESPIKMSHTIIPFNIIATKTYFTTFTYFTTLLQGSNDDGAETKINSRTKVVGNTVTETISPADLNSDYLLQLNSSLQRISGSIVATATLKQGDPIVITAYKGSSIGHSYEKYAITPTKTTFDLETKLELNQIIEEEKETPKIKSTSTKSIVILPKTKSSFTQKQKFKPTKTVVDEVTAEALVATEEENLVSVTPTVTLTAATPSLSNHRTEPNSFTYSADVTASSSSTVQESTVSSEDKEYPVEDETEEVSVDSVTDPPKKKQTLKQPTNPVNVSSLLNLNSLGINGMNVLGPVFNAMAEIIHNNLNKNVDVLSRRNDTVSPSKETEQIVKKPTSTNINPLLNFVNKFTSSTPKGTSEPKVKVTTPRTPVYIPVGSFAQDSDYGESQDSHLVIANRPELWHEKWKDSNGKNFEKVRPHDNPITILEGGIPISPGQVITTNSDVIIGRPGESGPRPPTFAVKNNVPVDMKPPPMPPVLPDLEEEDDFLGQHSTNQGADFDLSTEELNIIPPHSPLSPPKKHLHEFPGHKLPRPRPIDRHRGSPHHKNPHFGKHTHAEYDSGTMDLNPPPVPPPPIRTHEVHRPITINHEQDHEPVPYKTSQNVLPIPVHLGSNKNIESYINPSGTNAAGVVGVPGVAVLNQIYHENLPPLAGEPTPNIDVVNPNGILVIPTVTHIPLNLVETSNPNLVDRSTGHQLLVNIQPSQVANIVIPHGSSTALIVSGGKQHSLKGEVIDDPSPHPEPETVGFVGAEPVLKIESDDIATSLHNEVVSQTIATDGTKSGSQDNRILFSNRPQLTTELIKIRPKPIFGEVVIPDQHSTSEQHTQNLFFGQNLAFNRQPLPIPQSTVQNYHKVTSSHAESHHQEDGNLLHQAHNHRNEGQNGLRGSGGIYSGANHKNQNPAKGIPGKIHVNQNYRKESQNINSPGPNYFSNHKGGPTSQKIPPDAYFGQSHHGDHGYVIGTSGPYLDQSVFNQGHNFVKGGNGIYVDISPPGHLPPRPDVGHVHESHSSTKHQTSITENLSSHQSGVVHDVPLNAQVQLGSGKKKENPLKEILISSNTNKHDSISYESNEKPLDPKFSESQNHVKRPVLELPDNLSPPPLPKEGSTYRPQRPPFIPNHPHHAPTSTIQRYPPHPHPAIPEPADFMIPPPQIANRPNHKPHLDSRPVIPIGAGAPQQNYPNPRPEDIVIIPHKTRPGPPVSNHVHNIKQEVQKPLDSNLYSDLDVSDTRDPIKTEYGEEIQESISRPLFPGQLPSELQKYNTTQKVHSNSHKDSDALKFRPNLEGSQGTKIKGSSQKTETTGQTVQTKPVAGSIWNTPFHKHQSEAVSNVSNNRPSNHNYNQKQESNSEEQNKTASGLSFGHSQGDLILGSVKKPSGFVTANKGDTTSTGNHKDVSSFTNHRETFNLSNHREETSSFESVKQPSPNRGTTKFNLKKPGSSPALPDFVLSNNENSNIRIHAVGPNKLPSGFVKNEDAVSNKAPTENVTKDKLNVDHSTHFTTNNKGASGFVTTNNNKESSGVSEKTPESGTTNKASNASVTKDKPSGSTHSVSGVSHNVDVIYPGHNKLPGRYGPTGTSQSHKTSSNNPPQKYNVHGGGGQVGRPNKNPEPADITSSIQFDSNKVSFGYPTVTNVDIHDIGSNSPPKYSGTDKITGSVKRPSGFTTTKKEEPNKLPTGSSAGDSIPPIVTGTKKLPAKRPVASHDVIPSGSVKVPTGFAGKNQTSVSIGVKPNHNYENKTISYYGTVPVDLYDVNQEHDAGYSNLENEADQWFASNFPGHVVNTKPNKLGPHTAQRNVSSTPSTVLPNPSDVRITLLNPPKVTEVKTKPEEVMGLSPPPLERPRRPQRPQRPKPPYKFEIPSTPKPTLTPIAIENDFPPVRSPEMNRKPLKPQDIFPPRLPDNFVHHIPEYPIRGPPKPRPLERPVTSLPIDIPGTSTTENSSNVYPIDEEENDGSDPFFAGSEINGHSKPIFNNGPVIGSVRPPPTLTPTSRPKPVTHQKPSNVYQQPSKIRPSERPKVEETLPETKHKTVVTTKRQEISPTATQEEVGKTTYHTKVSASVTPTETYPYKDWHGEDIITGSETIFDVDLFSNRVTPTITGTTSKKKIVTSFISSGSTTIFGNLFTAQQTPDSNTDFVGSFDVNESSDVNQDSVRVEKTSVTPTQTIAPMRTTTLTVTTTMTTVVHSVGHKPSTKTIVLTKTLISTVFNKITETKTLVKPTTATIIQTHTIATTKTALVVPTALYPTHTKYPAGGTMKPEIFMADPHAKDTMTISVSSSMNKNAEDKRKQGTSHSDNDSIMVVMSNKHPNINLSVNDESSVVSSDENEINDSRVMVGGVFDANDEKEFKDVNRDIECSPSCKAKRNELCQRIEGVMKCVCRPGFARMFPDRPCRPTYTYKVKLMLEKLGTEQISYEKNFAQMNSPNMAKLTSATKEGLDRMIMQSDLRDVYHGVMVNGFQEKDKKTMVDFSVQLSENTDETKLMNIFQNTLRTSNYSLGGTELFAAREAGNLDAEDFNECLNPQFHDCSDHARCFNLKGTYTCSCKEGYTDLSENSLFPGRVCSDLIGCEYCGYHGACYSKGEGQVTCECFQWYSGERCQINLKVLLIALVTIGAILLALLLVCAVLTCLNRRSRSSTTSRTNGYLRYRGPSSQSMDRRAMIGDSSSESSVENLPYITPPALAVSRAVGPQKKPALRHAKGPAPRPIPPQGMEQRDRSVTVMIPRAKYRPMPPLSPHLTMSTFAPDKHLHKTAAQIATEQKLISYLDGNTREERTLGSANRTENNRTGKEQQQKNYDYKSQTGNTNESPRLAEKKKESKVFEYEYKISNMLFTEETNSADRKSARSTDNDKFRRHSDSTHMNADHSHLKSQFRKYSAGALVSAGYEVSAKVGMHHIEDDTTEDEHSGILNSHTMKSSRSQFTTLNRTGDHKTMSEARSYDETTIHPPTRSLKTHYSGSSPSSRVNNDEGHTMIERDLGSTFILPESQLFKPDGDRGSDISNFDSL